MQIVFETLQHKTFYTSNKLFLQICYVMVISVGFNFVIATGLHNKNYCKVYWI